MSSLKDETEAIKKVFEPLLRKEFFVKRKVKMYQVHQKLKTEGMLSQDEISIKHPFRPDIDVLYWRRDYKGEPKIFAAEVKYFRIVKEKIYPTIYESLGEAMMLLTFGCDYVSLWHLFDQEITPETVSEYTDLTQNLISGTASPVNYRSWRLDAVKGEPALDMFSEATFTITVTSNLRSNPLMHRWNTNVIRSIIKKRFRMISRT